MPRGARLDTPGTLYHVIVRGIEENLCSSMSKIVIVGCSGFLRRKSDTGW